MRVYNQQNKIAADRWNEWTPQRGGLISENYSVEYDCKDKSDVNSKADRQIEFFEMIVQIAAYQQIAWYRLTGDADSQIV